MKYNFDRIVDRTGTDSVKYDLVKTYFGREDILPMWVADMDFEVPDFIRKAVIERAEHPVYGYTYRPVRFFKVIAEWLSRRHGWEVSPGAINFSPGIVPALNLCVMAYTDPGDRVLVQPPVYFPFFSAVTNHNRELVYNQLMEEDGTYRIDFEDLEEQFKKGVRMMLFCHPHNPVGRAWNRDELEQLAALCLKYQVLIVSDEIHSDLLLFGNRHIPLASLHPEIADLTITCVAPSKTFNLAGLHSSAVIITHPERKATYDNILDQVHVGGGNLFGMVAMEAAYRLGDEWLEQLLAYLEKNFLMLKEKIQGSLPELVIAPLEATYLVWMDLSFLGLGDKELKKFIIHDAGLGLNDGPMFGPGGSGYQRLNIATSRQILSEGIDRLIEAVHSIR